MAPRDANKERNAVVFLWCLVAVCVAVAGVALAKYSLGNEKWRRVQEENLWEAVFRYQFAHNGSGQQQAAHIYFIGITIGTNRVEPSNEFMKRFANHMPPVKRLSACHFARGVGLIDNKTGEQGLSFFISDIRWISNTEVEVMGGYYEAELSASVNLYTLRMKGGRWTVVGDKLEGMSILSDYGSTTNRV